jgi:transposase
MSQRSSVAAVVNVLHAEVVSLRARVVALETENQRLREAAAAMPPRSPAAADAEPAATNAAIARLEAEIAALKRERKNSSNSSKPPSSDHPHDPKSERHPKKDAPATERKRGGQPGHPGTTRALLPVEEVQQVVPCVPAACRQCQAALPQLPGGTEPAPIREQLWELPPIPWEVTEFQRHCRTCADCGARTWGERPPEAPAGCLGFRAQGMIGIMTGGAQLSRRAALTLISELTGLPLSLGALSAVEATLRQALAAAYEEVGTAVAAAAVVYCDETPWRAETGKPWLWTAATPAATYFRIASRRDSEAFLALGLDTPGQIKVTDRYSVYTSLLDPSEHGLCWSHLDRDFRGWVGHPSAAGAIARWLAAETQRVFTQWHAFQRGECDRAGLAVRLETVQTAIRTALKWGAESGVPQFQGLCRNLQDRWESLWTFVRVAGVEPTNNRAERAVRPAVLWRKTSLFSQSERGREYVERLLTVKTTLRQNGGNLLEFLTETLRAARCGLPPPKLLAPVPL